MTGLGYTIAVGGSGGGDAANIASVPSAPAYNLAPGSLAKWRAALAEVRRGTGQARIMCVGDSTTIGLGVSVQGSWPSWLTKKLHAPAVDGFALTRTTTVADSRWTLGTGWTFQASNAAGFGHGSQYTATTGTAGTLTFTPGLVFDTVDVYFRATPANGTSVVTISETTANLVTGSADTFGKQTITVPAGNNSIVFAPPTGGNVNILGIDAYLSTTAQVRVGNAGRSSSTSADWAYTGDAWNSAAGLAAYDPDLTIVMLGINDAIAVRSVSAVQADITALCTAAEAFGSVIVASVIPTSNSDTAALEASYRDMLRTLSAARGWPLIDIFQRFGSYTAANTLGFMSDTVHGSAAGYADIGTAIASVLNDGDDSAVQRIAAAPKPLTSYLLWNVGNQICAPQISAGTAATISQTSGQPLLTGGPGMVVPAGQTVQGLTFVSNAASTALTHCFAFVAIPDETGLAQATVVAVSQNLGSATWAANTARKFSLRQADGGSGFWTPTVDTPVFAGVVQVGSGLATLRGFTASAQVIAALTPMWSASSSSGVTTPATLASVLSLSSAASFPFARLSSVYN